MRISDWSSDVCASDLERPPLRDLLSALSGLHDRVAAQTMDAVSHGEEIYDHARLLMGLAGALALLMVIGAVAMVMLLVSRRLRRSEERRVGEECVSTGRTRGSAYNEKKKQELKKQNKQKTQ